VQLVNHAKRTRCKKGTRRVRVVGVGEDKAQITATLGITGDGEVLPYQLIFAGKTVRCHPRSPVPEGCLMSHTPTHWQSGETYFDFVEQVIIPFKNRRIHDLGLPPDQWTILKQDLHYSHKTPDVLRLCSENKIAVLFVPAGCTDIMQECDRVVNAPFKKGLKAAFRDFLHADYAAFVANGENNSADWNVPLTMRFLKDHIVSFVNAGIDALCTPQMSDTYVKCFQTDGLFDVMLDDDHVASARQRTHV
jgi:hypothetical protein